MMRESMAEVWKSVWGECGGCVEVRESVLGCEEVWGRGRANTLFYTFPHTLHTHPTPLPILTQHLSPAPPHSPDTSLHTFPHSLPHTSPHPSHLYPHFPSPSQILSHTHSPYFVTTPTPPPTLPYAPHTLSFTPCQNFLTFLIYSQISLTIKYNRNSL